MVAAIYKFLYVDMVAMVVFQMEVSSGTVHFWRHFKKPYSQTGLTTDRRICNYRLSRARCIVENAFGILSNRFWIFMAPIGLKPEKVEAIVLACCSLRNYLSPRPTSRANIFASRKPGYRRQ